MAKTGLSYYKSDTDRYQDIKIKRLKKSFSCNGIAVYDYILNEVYRIQGCFLEWDEHTAFDVAEYFGLKESLVNEIVKYCASVGLFSKELLCRGIITSRSIQERYLQICTQAKRREILLPEDIKLVSENSGRNAESSGRNAENSGRNAESSGNTPEEMPKTPETFDKEKYSKVKYSKENNNLPQNACAYARGGGNNLNFYSELCKYAQCREDVWEAVAITGSFQNSHTQAYREWLALNDDDKRGYPLHSLNSYLRTQVGDINIEYWNAICWVKDNLLETQFRDIYTILQSKPTALTELRKLIKECQKGKINNPGIFITKKLKSL